MRRPLLILSAAALGCGSSGGATSTSGGDTANAVDTAVPSDDLGGASDTAAEDALAEDTSASIDAEPAVDVEPVADVEGSPDAEANPDTESAQDVASVDTTAGAVATPFGPVDGICGTLLSSELMSSAPSFYVNTWHLDSDTLDTTKLAAKPMQRLSGPNAGGSSKCSEVMSMELLSACEGASTYKLEVEVAYDAAGSLTDYVAEKDGTKIGVSVSRAYLGPNVNTYTGADAVKLLTKKLEGINQSSADVSAADKWQKQVLHIFTLHADWAGVLETAWDGLDGALKADTVVLVTVEDGTGWIVTDTCDN